MDILKTKTYNPFKLTALKRNQLSNPMKYLSDGGYITKDKYILDYGCGHGDDIKILKSIGYKNIHGYDKYNLTYLNNNMLSMVKQPDIITCNYVFNTIHTMLEHKRVLHNLRKTHSDIYISVRRDFKAIKTTWKYDKINMSYKTSRGSYQRFYTLEMIHKLFGKVEVIKATSAYILFKLK